MSEVVKFVRKRPTETPEVIRFKTDLKMFMAFLDKIDYRNSAIAMVQDADTTTNNLISHYLSDLLDSVKRFCKRQYELEYSSISLVNKTLYDSVYAYLEWSEHFITPIFEFDILNSIWNFRFTTVAVGESVIITNITDSGLPFLPIVVSHLASFFKMEMDNGRVLTSGSASIGVVGNTEFQPGHYHYIFTQVDGNFDLKNVATIGEGFNTDSLGRYLVDTMHTDEYIFMPFGTEFVRFDHPLIEKPIDFFASDFPLQNLLPIGQMDRDMEFTAFTQDQSIRFEYDPEESTWIPSDAVRRNDVDFINYVEKLLLGHNFKGKIWDIQENKGEYRVPYHYDGKKGNVLFVKETLTQEGNANLFIEGYESNPAMVHLRIAPYAPAMVVNLDVNTGLVSTILDDINE